MPFHLTSSTGSWLRSTLAGLRIVNHPRKQAEAMLRAALVSAIAQTITLANTYGTTFSSGALSYGGGDGAQELYEQLKQKGTPL